MQSLDAGFETWKNSCHQQLDPKDSYLVGLQMQWKRSMVTRTMRKPEVPMKVLDKMWSMWVR